MTRHEFWRRYLRVYDTLNMLEEYRAYQDDLAHRLCARPGLRILDAGSGTGNLSIRMRGLAAEVLSLDFSKVALTIHREKDPSASQALGSLEQPLPFPDDSFDCVACASVLFALSDAGVRLALSEFRRVLRPGGALLVTATRKKMSLVNFCVKHLASRKRGRSLLALLGEVLSMLKPGLKLLYYTLRIRTLRHRKGYRRFSKENLLDMVRDAGFERTRLGLTFSGHFHVVEAVTPAAMRS